MTRIVKSFTDFPFSPNSEEHVHLAWEFSWPDLEKLGIIGFEGSLTVSYKNEKDEFVPITINVKLSLENKRVESQIDKLSTCQHSNEIVRFKYEFKLTPIRETSSKSEGTSVRDAKFHDSELTDIVLDVEGRKVHVCKKHLAIHSDYFRTLFFADFKEKTMDEIPIVDVKYEDFILLLEMIYPNAPLPNDATSESLLELADRFLMYGVSNLVQRHLCNASEIPLTKMIHLADKYQIPELRDKCVSVILSDSRENCIGRVKVVKSSSFYKGLSVTSKFKILETVYSY